jgi:hypothetical protein
MRPLVKAYLLLLAVAATCSASTGRMAEVPEEPAGCCCAYGDCREEFTQEACARKGEFQGWTYTWHAGECATYDVYPALDHPLSSR